MDIGISPDMAMGAGGAIALWILREVVAPAILRDRQQTEKLMQVMERSAAVMEGAVKAMIDCNLAFVKCIEASGGSTNQALESLKRELAAKIDATAENAASAAHELREQKPYLVQITERLG